MKAWIKPDSYTSWLLSVDWRCSMGKTICQNGTHDQAEPCLICSIYHLLCCWCGSALLEHESCNDGNEKKSMAYDQWPKQILDQTLTQIIRVIWFHIFARVDIFLHILAPCFGQHNYCSGSVLVTHDIWSGLKVSFIINSPLGSCEQISAANSEAFCFGSKGLFHSVPISWAPLRCFLIF